MGVVSVYVCIYVSMSWECMCVCECDCVNGGVCEREHQYKMSKEAIKSPRLHNSPCK